MRFLIPLLGVLGVLSVAYSGDRTVVATEDGRVVVAERAYGTTPYYGCNNYYTPQNYYNNNYHVVQKVVAQDYSIQPLYVGVPVQPAYVNVHATGSPYYYSVSQAYNEKAYLRDVLREELRNILGNGEQPAAPATPRGSPIKAPTPPGKAQADTGGRQQLLEPDTTTPPELQKQVLAAYQGKGGCLDCHGATGKASGPNGKEFRLVTDDGQGGIKLAKLSSDKRWKIHGMSAVGAMPPSAATDAAKAMENEFIPVLLQYAVIKD